MVANFYKVGALDELFFWEVEDVACGVAAYFDEFVDDPFINFVGEFAQVDVFVVFVGVAIDFYFVAAEFAGEFDVAAAFTDGEGDLVGGHEDFGAFFSFFEDRVQQCLRVLSGSEEYA